MKKTLNEKQLRSIIRNTIRESLMEMDKDAEMDYMYDEYGNRSIYPNDEASDEMYLDDEDDPNAPGLLSMAAQGGNPDEIGDDLNGDLDNVDFDKLGNDINANIAQNDNIWASKKGDWTGKGEGIYESRLDRIVKEAVSKAIRNRR